MNPLDSYQIPLFQGNHTYQTSLKEAIKKVTWSYSRRSTLEQCARRYYYAYYGANKLIAKQEPQKETLHFLKYLENRHQRTGYILHLTIRTFFHKAQAGDYWSPDQLVDFASSIFSSDRYYSRDHPEGDGLSEKRYPPVLLREYHYRTSNADELCEEAEVRMIEALKSFSIDEQYDRFRLAGSTADALVEHTFKLSNFPCRMSGKIDLAYNTKNQVTVIDWKLGKNDMTGDDSLQLAAYGLWAKDYYDCDPETLIIDKIHLSSGEIIGCKVDSNMLSAARARITQDAERIAVMDEYGKKARAEAFTPCSHPLVCAMCEFEKVCNA